MNRVRFFFLPLMAATLLSAACGAARSAVPFSDASGHPLALYALSGPAGKGILEGDGAVAWFRFDAGKAFPGTGGAIEVAVEAGLAGAGPATAGAGQVTAGAGPATAGAGPVTVSLALVSRADLDDRGRLVAAPAPRPLSRLARLDGKARIRMLIPASPDICGFVVGLAGSADSRLRITGASLARAETGWRAGSEFWAGFGAEGGLLDASAALSGEVAALPVVVPAGSLLTLNFAAAPPGLASPAEASPGASAAGIASQARTSFSADGRTFSVRNAPAPFSTAVPSLLLGDRPVTVSVAGPAGSLAGMTVSRGTPLAVADGANPSAPIHADPNLIIEWPRSAWRRSDREIFAWDRFPSILIFDTADYAVQDRLFKRLAFYVEKEGYRGRLLTDAEMAGKHAFNAHDYRAESLASFFGKARSANFPLNRDELELLDVLLAEGIVVRKGSGYAAGAGAVLSFSRESPGYMRYMFMAHEGYHGLYFIDADFRAKVSGVYRTIDSRAISWLESYFTSYGSLGYDTNDRFLMENEFMGYLMQQPLDKVSRYFTDSINGRFIMHDGDPALAAYIAESQAGEFVRAAEDLNGYVYARWGISGGRTGLFSF